jgi:hypothetical protein
MSRRAYGINIAEDFPTPEWATRALMKYGIRGSVRTLICLEPASGNGHMVRVLRGYFDTVRGSDAFNDTCGDIRDFLADPYPTNWFDWVITNPPYRFSQEFFHEALRVARIGVALLLRTTWVEGVGRYNKIFRQSPPTIILQFSERVPMVAGTVNPDASTATAYAWFIWHKGHVGEPIFRWIPPCRKELSHASDYPRTNQQSGVGRGGKLPPGQRWKKGCQSGVGTQDVLACGRFLIRGDQGTWASFPSRRGFKLSSSASVGSGARLLMVAQHGLSDAK